MKEKESKGKVNQNSDKHKTTKRKLEEESEQQPIKKQKPNRIGE
jgi:hypothetical protein